MEGLVVESSNYPNLGLLIKSILKERSLSLSKLSKLTEIDKSTLSRIVNNKQKPNINHLNKLATTLKIPLEDLLFYSGYNLKSKKQTQSFDINTNYEHIDDLLEFSNLIDNSTLEKNIKNQLNTYKQYIKTDEGKNILHKTFNEKLKLVDKSGIFIDTLKDMYDKFCCEDTPLNELILIGSALLYFIIPTDIIPDFIFPIGFLDDIIALKIVLNSLDKLKKLNPNK